MPMNQKPAVPNHECNPIDRHVGQRIRMRRLLLGYTQKKMAAKLGITFQQLQKYENGINRISASRLWDVSVLLNSPVEFFFAEMDNATQKSSPMMLAGTNLPIDKSPEVTDPLHRQETIRLVNAFYKITNPRLSKKILELMLDLAGNG